MASDYPKSATPKMLHCHKTADYITTDSYLSFIAILPGTVYDDGMTHHAMFPDLVFDENDNRVEVAYVGGDAHYVIDDMGFKRHVPAESLDRQIVEIMMEQLQGNQDMAVDQALRMMGQDDLFTKAAVDSQIRNTTVEDVVGQMIPPQAREMMAMMGFKIIVNYRGELVKFDQPSMPLDGDGDY